MEEAAWLVVHFTNDNTVAAIPRIWYIFDKNRCHWPPKHLRRQLPDFIRKKEIPDEDWDTFPAKILGQYDELQTAKRKALKAQDTSDLSSNSEHVQQTLKRKRARNFKYVVSTDSENDIDEDDETAYPVIPKKTTTLAHPTDERQQDRFQNRKNQRLYAASSQSSQLHIDKKVIQRIDKVRSQVDSPRSESEDYNNSQQERVLQRETNSPTQQWNLPHYIGTAEPSLQMREFQRQVLNQLNVINAKLSENSECLQLLLRQQHNNVADEVNKENLLDDILHLFPLNTEHQLNEIEEFLKLKENMTAMVKELSRMGGGSAKELTKKIMYRVYSNELGQLFSWDGAKGKRPFKNLLLSQVIIKAVGTNQRTKHCDEDESIKTVKMWLVRAKDRMRNSLQKKQKPNNENEPAAMETDNNME